MVYCSLQCINEAREILDSELTALAGESHSRAYPALVNCQLLAELEEVIQYKLMPERQTIIRQAWWDRLQVSALINMAAIRVGAEMLKY